MGIPGGPIVSVVMANYNGARYVEAAMASVLGQTLHALELIVSDDCSTDDSLARIRAMAERDPRVRVLASEVNRGAAAARNRAFDLARGEWIAVVDSDDLIHPARFDKLVDWARRDRADIAADDLTIFSDDAHHEVTTCLRGRYAHAPFWVGAAAYINANVWRAMASYFRLNLFGEQDFGWGYLKPLINRAFLERSGARYNQALRLAEDYDLVLRLLLEGARYRVYPEPLYRYRRSTGSTSYRTVRPRLTAMIEQADALFASATPGDPKVLAAHRRWRSALVTAIQFEDLVAGLRTGDLGAALAIALRHPRAAAQLRAPVFNRLAGRRAVS